MQDGVGRSAGRRDRRDRVFERRARDDVARAEIPAEEIHDALTGCARDGLLLRIVGRHAAAPERGDAEEFERDRHRVRGELAAAGAGAWTRRVLEPAQIGIAERAGGVRPDRFEDVLNRHGLAVPLPRRDRSTVQDQAGHVETRERHRRRRNRLVAADEHDETVEAVAARDQLDRVGDDFAAHERGAHPFGTHRDPVGDRDGVELHRRAAGAADALFHVDGEIAQVVVARTDLDPRVGDTDERLLEIGVGEADGLQHRARGSAMRAGGQRIPTQPRRVRAVGGRGESVAHETTSNGSGSQPSCDFQLAYEPSVRSVGANSARCASARAHGRSSRAAATSA